MDFVQVLNDDYVRGLTLIGNVKNNWREREVFVFETDDPNLVKTIGVSFHENIAPVRAIEPRESFKRAIAIFPKREVYN